MFTKAGDLVACVRTLLNDPKAERYDDAGLVKFLGEAVTQAYAARPSLATEIIQVQLKPGTRQSVPDGYSFVEVVGIENDPEQTGVSSELDDVMAKRFGGLTCAAKLRCAVDERAGPGAAVEDGEPFGLSSAKPISSDPRAFVVAPSVPDGANVRVDVSAVNLSKGGLELGGCSPLPKTFDAAVLDYALYRAYSIEIESAYAQAQAQQYYQSFCDRLNIFYNGEARVKSGFNMGLDGTGNERVGPSRDLRGIDK